VKVGLAAIRSTGTENGIVPLLNQLAAACIQIGRFDEGKDALTEALAAADEREDRSNEAWTHLLRGVLFVVAKRGSFKYCASFRTAFSRQLGSRGSRAPKWRNCMPQ
jgi:hypothetical protein